MHIVVCCVHIVHVHCYVKFNAMFKLIACGRNFFVVFIHGFTSLLVDHFS